MGWAQKPVAAKGGQPDPLLAGIDLNAMRVRAVYGTSQVAPRPLPLTDAHSDLPMAISLEARRPQVGRPGAESVPAVATPRMCRFWRLSGSV